MSTSRRECIKGVSSGAAAADCGRQARVRQGHVSTLLCQLGNIAHRAGHSIDVDRQTGHLVGHADAARYWSRAYEKGWEMSL
jgi:hypothetical protein